MKQSLRTRPDESLYQTLIKDKLFLAIIGIDVLVIISIVHLDQVVRLVSWALRK